jgi:hypothetical protein
MLGLWMKAVHILTVLWLVGGVVGRDICHRGAARTDDLHALRTLIGLGSVFERTMVRPATFVVLVTGLLAAWRLGWPILGVLQGASINWVLTALLIYLSMIPIIIFVFLPRGRVFRQALQEASAQGIVTPGLRAALADPAVRAARRYELFTVVALVLLMVFKPF